MIDETLGLGLLDTDMGRERLPVYVLRRPSHDSRTQVHNGAQWSVGSNRRQLTILVLLLQPLVPV